METFEHALHASRSWDGYEREHAVHTLATTPCTVALQAVLVRLNDWVPQVRQAAQAAFQRYLDESRVDDLLANLDGYLALHGKTRHDFAGPIRQTDDLLGQPAFRSRLLPLFRQSYGRVARYLFQRLCAQGIDVALAEEALRHREPSVRAAALNVLGSLPAETAALIAAGVAWRGRPASLRSAALRIALGRMTNETTKRALCRDLLLDPSTGPRSAAGWYARQLGEDVDAWYRAAAVRESLHNSELTALLRESVGTSWPEGLQLAEKHSAHPVVTVRMAACQVLLARSSGDEQYRWLEKAIDDRSPKIRKAAAASLRWLYGAPSEARHALTLRLWRSDPDYALYLSRKLPLLPRLGLLVDLLSWPAPPVQAEQLLQRFNQWSVWFGESSWPEDQRQWLMARLNQPLVPGRLKDCALLMEQLRQRGLLP